MAAQSAADRLQASCAPSANDGPLSSRNIGLGGTFLLCSKRIEVDEPRIVCMRSAAGLPVAINLH